VQTENPYRGDLGSGRFWFLMPDLVGNQLDQARAKIRDLGFTSKEVEISYVDRPGCGPNVICETYPESLTRTDNTSDKRFYVGRPIDRVEPQRQTPARPDPKQPPAKQPPPTQKKPDDIF
jgi:beta-lactam-binding protein with PASTA domain